MIQIQTTCFNKYTVETAECVLVQTVLHMTSISNAAVSMHALILWHICRDIKLNEPSLRHFHNVVRTVTNMGILRRCRGKRRRLELCEKNEEYLNRIFEKLIYAFDVLPSRYVSDDEITNEAKSINVNFRINMSKDPEQCKRNIYDELVDKVRNRDIDKTVHEALEIATERACWILDTNLFPELKPTTTNN